MIDDEKLSKKAKIITASGLIILSILAYFYEIKFEEESKFIGEVSTGFNQGLNLKCANLDVNSTNFEFSFATHTFISKKDAKGIYKDRIFSVKECRLDE